MKALLTTVALIALVSAAPAWAQTEPAVTEPAPTEIVPDADATAPMKAPDAAATEMPAAPADTAAAPAEAAPGDSTFLAAQGADEGLVSEWIGQTVYNANDENIGDINDLVTAQDGSIKAVVLGVGGFLGLGEKSVAVPFEAIEAQVDPTSGAVIFRVALTMEQLEAAPEFKTLAAIRMEEQANQPPPAPDAAAPAPALQ